MNLLFNRTHVYNYNHPQEYVQHKLKYICNRRFEDFSVDLIGNVKSDGSFELTNKWGFTNTTWLENREAYMRGGLKYTNGKPAIVVRLRPNIIFTTLFYIGLLLLVLELCGIKILPLPQMAMRVSILAVWEIAVAIFIIKATSSLRNRFERLMQLN